MNEWMNLKTGNSFLQEHESTWLMLSNGKGIPRRTITIPPVDLRISSPWEGIYFSFCFVCFVLFLFYGNYDNLKLSDS